MSAARARRVPRPRPALTLRIVLLLVAIAVLMPALTTLGHALLTIAAGADGLAQGYQLRLCRRGSCLGDGMQRGPTDIATAGAVLALPWFVAGAGLGLSLLTRRRGWMTVPLTILHVLFALTTWNQLAWAVAGGEWWGQLLLVAVAFGVPLAMVGLGELAVPVWRQPRRRQTAGAALSPSDAAAAGGHPRGPAWAPPAPRADARLAGHGALAQPFPKLEPQRVADAAALPVVVPPPVPTTARRPTQQWAPALPWEPAQQQWPTVHPAAQAQPSASQPPPPPAAPSR